MHRLTGYALAAGTWAVAIAGFPTALAVGVALHIAMHHTPSGRASMQLLDALADRDDEQETS